jgi:cell division protein ZapE
VLELDGGQDYRLALLRDMRVYHHPLGEASAIAMRDSFHRMTGGTTPSADHLIVHGRRLDIPRQAGGVAWFEFAELCERPLGAADYLAIATHFNVVLIDDVPVFALEQRDAARRFMILIDALYEHRVAVVISAAEVPERLFASADDATQFERTVSRLSEMQSSDYLSGPHLT